jgi:hypothetical protein
LFEDVIHHHTHHGYHSLQQREAVNAEQHEEEEKERKIKWRRALLEWLIFAQIHDRREQVGSAHQETFKWVLEVGNKTGFAEWVRTGSGIFWIRGKPASGKSTLMKFIEESPRLKSCLGTWSGCEPLVTVSSWFWSAGSELQRSLVGLYRSLLYQILEANDDLCHESFPEWHVKFYEKDPTIETLTAAMRKALLAIDRMTTRYFLMIDGLDEYESDSIGKTQLAKFMLELAASSNVKLVLTSRPEPAFEFALRGLPTLRLEALTRPDISAFTKTSLRSHIASRELSRLERDGFTDIENFIVDHAEGVFLWVAIVVRIALDGFMHFEDLIIIRDRIMSLPAELDELFTHILTHRIPQHSRGTACRYLAVMLEWTLRTEQSPEGPIIIIAQQASSYAQACYVASWEREQVEAAIANFPSRLKTCCYGLLECDEGRNMHVRFLHRTLFDYLNQAKLARTIISSGVGDAFEVHAAIMAGLICAKRLKKRPFVYGGNWVTMMRLFLKFNSLAERSTQKHKSELISILDNDEMELPTQGETFDHRGKRRTNGILPKELRPGSDLLAFVVYAGGNLHLRDAITRQDVVGVDRLSVLLHYAVPPYLLDAEQPHSERIRDDINAINVEAVALLLENGADSAHILDGRSLWSHAIDRLSPPNNPFAAESRTSFQGSSELLALLTLLIRNMKDQHNRSRCSALKVPSPSLIAREIHKSILTARCCAKLTVQRCQCSKAQEWTRTAKEALDLMRTLEKKSNPQVGSASERHMEIGKRPPRLHQVIKDSATLATSPQLGEGRLYPHGYPTVSILRHSRGVGYHA